MAVFRWDTDAFVDLRTGRRVTRDSNPDGYLPVWGMPVFEDTFNGDLSKWNIRNNFSTIDTARGMASNATVEDGLLHLKGTWLENAPVTGGPQGVYTHDTGYIDTRNNTSGLWNPPVKHFSQQYGRWEIRCQTPTGPNTRGALAAFWLRCDSTPGEIDIMEAWGYGGTMASDHTTYIKDSAVTTFHSSTMSEAVNGKPYTKTMWRHWQHGVPRTAWQGMHTYAFEYMPDYIATFVDGIQVMKVYPTTPDPMNAGKNLSWLWDPDFFGSPMHIRINLHVGPSASYWGLPDPDNRALTQDPLDFKIDYVRAYAAPGGA